MIASCPYDIPDLAEIYTQVFNVLIELAHSAKQLAARNNIVLLELSGEGFSSHVIVLVNNKCDSILSAFQQFLDELVQFNAELPAHNNLELILQVVKNPNIKL